MQQNTTKLFQEFRMLLKVTDINYGASINKFNEIQKEINAYGPTKILISDLSYISRTMFQNNYMLLEKHLEIKKFYKSYSLEEQKVIDEFSELYRKVDELTDRILSYIKYNQTANNNSLSL